MNIRAAKFVQNLRGLTVSEKSVALNMANHADYKDATAYMSMTTLAAESGLKNRETASRIVKRLEAAGIIQVMGSRSGGRTPTKYQFTVCANRDWGVTPPVTGESRLKVKATVTGEEPNRDFGDDKTDSTVTQNDSTVTGESHEGLEGKRKKGGEEVTAIPNPSPLPVSISPAAHTGESRQQKKYVPSATRVVSALIQYAKEINPAAAFSGKSKQDLKEAVNELINMYGDAYDDGIFDITQDTSNAVREKIHQCDAFALRNFGSSLAVELVALVSAKHHRLLDAEYAKEKL